MLQLLTDAVRRGDAERVAELLLLPPPPPPALGFSLLEAACCGHRDILEMLLDAAGVTEPTPPPDARGRSPLHFAAASGDFSAAQLLLARGADVEVRRHHCCRKATTQMVPA